MLVVHSANCIWRQNPEAGEEEVGPERHRQSSHVSRETTMQHSPDTILALGSGAMDRLAG